MLGQHPQAKGWRRWGHGEEIHLGGDAYPRHIPAVRWWGLLVPGGDHETETRSQQRQVTEARAEVLLHYDLYVLVDLN